MTAINYSDLKAGLSVITPPAVQTRALLQARMVLGAANTMMPDPEVRARGVGSAGCYHQAPRADAQTFP